jgi:hypothetical protein
MLSPAQAGFTLVVVLALVAAAMLPRWRRTPPRRPGRVPHPLLLGLGVLVAHLSLWFASGWWGIGVRLAVIVAVVALLVAWSRRSGWGGRHVVAAWSAGLVAAAAGAYAAPGYAPASPTTALVSDLAVSAVTLALVLGAYRSASTHDAAEDAPRVTTPTNPP